MMKKQKITSLQTLFSSRLDTLEHLLKKAIEHFGSEAESILQKRIVADMLPFGTQIAYTCNQPYRFASWCEGKDVSDLDPQVQSVAQARDMIATTKVGLMEITATDAKLEETKRLDFPGGIYVELPGTAYVDDFLIPNFYFHLVTAYDILRMEGVAIGKGDYMTHLMPLVRQG